MADDLLTIEQAAKLINVSKDTIRRRIKTGELEAEKHPGPYGDQWLLPSFQFEQAAMIKDVVPMTRQVSVAELQQAMQRVIADAVTQAVRAETAELKEKVAILEEKLDATSHSLDDHYALVDGLQAGSGELKEKVVILEEKLEATNHGLDGHYALVDERLRAEAIGLKEKVATLEEKLDATNDILDGHYRLVDQRLRQMVDEKNQKKSFWQRLFS